jgi:hypothetical protein
MVIRITDNNLFVNNKELLYLNNIPEDEKIWIIREIINFAMKEAYKAGQKNEKVNYISNELTKEVTLSW